MEAAQQQLDDLVRRYQHRVGFFAAKVRRSLMLGSRWDDDLISAGYWGLFKALSNRRLDAHENELSAYVSQRIHGAVLDEARMCITRTSGRELTLDGRGDEERGDEGAPAWLVAGERPPRNDPEELASQSWKRAAVQSALDGLEDSERRVLLAYMEGASLNEIAETEGISTGTMQVRFQKVSRALRARAPELRRILLDQDDV